MDEFVSFPFGGQIKIDFDSSKKVFFLSAPIFSCSGQLPGSIKKYVEVREKHSFHPYKTSFLLDGENGVLLVQELPFVWGFQPSFREQVHAFRRLSESCHHLLLEMAIEEKLEQIERFLNASG